MEDEEDEEEEKSLDLSTIEVVFGLLSSGKKTKRRPMSQLLVFLLLLFAVKPIFSFSLLFV